jgi:hypothetical protein
MGSSQQWADPAGLDVPDNRGVGTWLVGHAAAWARLGGCDRILFPVEAAGPTASTAASAGTCWPAWSAPGAREPAP